MFPGLCICTVYRTWYIFTTPAAVFAFSVHAVYQVPTPLGIASLGTPCGSEHTAVLVRSRYALWYIAEYGNFSG